MQNARYLRAPQLHRDAGRSCEPRPARGNAHRSAGASATGCITIDRSSRAVAASVSSYSHLAIHITPTDHQRIVGSELTQTIEHLRHALVVLDRGLINVHLVLHLCQAIVQCLVMLGLSLEGHLPMWSKCVRGLRRE